MDKKLNDLLIQEIRNTILNLQKDRTQLNDELAKYAGREDLPEKKEFENDIEKVSAEIKEKDADLEKIFKANATRHRVEKEEAKLEEQYEDLLKEREDCKAEIEKLKGRMELENGQFVPTREQREYESDLEKIEKELANYDSAKANNKAILQEQETIAEELVKKYKIREKYKDLEENKIHEDINENKKEDIEEAKPEEEQNNKIEQDNKNENNVQKSEPIEKNVNNEPKIDNSNETIIFPANNVQKINEVNTQKTEKEQQASNGVQNNQQASQPINKNNETPNTNLNVNPITPKTITSITCAIEKGKLIYKIQGLDTNGKQYIISKLTRRSSNATRKEKQEMKEIMNEGIKNVDIVIYKMLKNDNVFKDDKLLNTYLKQVEETSRGLGRHKDAINITYDLRNIKEAKIGFFNKLKIKNFANKAQKNKIAEYLKPQGKLKGMLTGIKQQNLLEAGRSIANVEQEKLIQENLDERPREQQVWSAYKQMHDEEGFDFEQFSQDMNLSEEEKNFIKTYEKGKELEKGFKKSLRDGVKIQEKPDYSQETESTVAINDIENKVEKDEEQR